MLEAAGRFDEAAQAYRDGLRLEPSHLGTLNQLCRLRLVEVSGALAGRFGISAARRAEAFEEAKVVCPAAVSVDPADAMANMHLGMLYKEGLDFPQAIVYLRRALQTSPKDVTVLTNLASALSRNNGVPEAVELTRLISKLGALPRCDTRLASYPRNNNHLFLSLSFLLMIFDLSLSFGSGGVCGPTLAKQKTRPGRFTRWARF